MIYNNNQTNNKY